MATIWPDPTAWAAGAVTWASTLPTATAMPSGRPVHAAASAVSVPACSPSCADAVLELVDDEVAEAGRERVEELRRRVRPVLEDALVAGRARVADVGPAELPHDPVGGLDPALHPVVERAVLLEELEPLGELPLRGDQPAVARQPGLAARAGEVVDPVGLALRGVVLPQLDVGVRPVRRRPSTSLSGVPSASVGTIVQAVKSVAMPMTPRRVDAGGGDGGRHGDAQHLAVVLGHLQRPLRRERRSVPARPGQVGRQGALEHGVRVGVDGGAELGAVGDPDDDGTAGQGAVVDADDVLLGLVWLVLLDGHGSGFLSTGTALLARTTSSGLIRRSGAGAPARAAWRISIARRPTAAKSWRTVVSGGIRYAASGMSSKPTTLTSPGTGGTRGPPRESARSRPSAIWSLAQKTAVTSSRRGDLEPALVAAARPTSRR